MVKFIIFQENKRFAKKKLSSIFSDLKYLGKEIFADVVVKTEAQLHS